MASTRFSAGLVSLYPRESEDLQLLLEQHRVASGRSDAVYSFPDTLNRDPGLQRDLTDFVATSRMNPRGPVSRGAMLHLLLTGIGGPEALDLGPEADEATRSITVFLERLGGWPEDAFADIGADDSFASPGSFRSSPPVPSRPRSIAASLASQNGHHDQLEFPPAAASPSAATLQEIVLALGRLEQSQHATTAKLEQISSRLRQMESVDGDPSLTAAAEAPVVDAEEPLPLAAEEPVPEFEVGAKTIIPTPTLSRLSPAPAEDILLELAPAPVPVDPAVATDLAGAERLANAAADPATPRHPAPPNQGAAPAPPTAAHRSSGNEWKELFAAPPARPKRSIAVLPVVVACLVLAAALVAGLIYFLHSEGTIPASTSDNTAAPAPALSEPAADSASSVPVSPAPRTSAPSRSEVRPQTAQNTSPESPGSTNRGDRVLGARETYQPRSSAEAFPQPRQPSFVAASTMDSRLTYAPPPQHPRIAGIVGLNGMVVMEVIVDSDGTVASVKVLGGHHLLRDAAVNAVRTWRYRPVLQNGRPVSVRTIVRMDFNKDVSQAKN